MATAVTPRPITLGDERPPPLWRRTLGGSPREGLARAGVVLASAVVIAGVVGRFLAPGGLWLDEALSVNIAKLPLVQLPGALVQDGSPPLYYLALHYWMLLFGQGDPAVRALSGIISTATLPFLWAAGQRAGGRRAAWAALLLGASSPWAIYFGTDTRMYSLMALESILWYLAVRRAMELPSRRRLIALAAVTAALMYTHYWDLYLVAVGGAWLLVRSWVEHRSGMEHRSWVEHRSGVEHRPGEARPPEYPGAAAKSLAAMIGGGLVWLPWSPVFVFQALHTGTPWAGAPSPADMLSVFGYFAGVGAWGYLLTFMTFGLVGLAIFAAPGPRATSVIVEFRAQPRARFVALLVVGALSAAVLAGILTGAAFDNRYIAVVFPLFIVLCALGITTFSSLKVTSLMLAVACTAGLLSAKDQNSQPRTQAVEVAAVLNAQAQPGDMIVYCPDQLGPAVDRLLKVPDVTQITFPRGIGPARVDWVNYVSRIQHTDVGNFAEGIVNKLNPGSTLWLVWRNGYLGLGGSCGYLTSWLQMLHPGGETLITENPNYYEDENLVRWPS
ncbi:MAG TPA: glycosyltransferase family 39 protein [Acidimicrobiales bacterium]|nr:glycosyltransferase family 39 protein [Acidimicrobiales bacterium]